MRHPGKRIVTAIACITVFNLAGCERPVNADENKPMEVIPSPTSVPEDTAVSAVLPEWKKIYKDYLENGCAGVLEYPQDLEYCYVYVDDDDIPELICNRYDDTFMAVLTINGDEVNAVTAGGVEGISCALDYSEKTNMMSLYEGNSSGYTCRYYSVENEQWKLISTLTVEDKVYEESGQYRYKIDGKETEAAEYHLKEQELIPSDDLWSWVESTTYIKLMDNLEVQYYEKPEYAYTDILWNGYTQEISRYTTFEYDRFSLVDGPEGPIVLALEKEGKSVSLISWNGDIVFFGGAFFLPFGPSYYYPERGLLVQEQDAPEGEYGSKVFYRVENGGLFCRNLSWYEVYDEESGEQLLDEDGNPSVEYYLGVRKLSAGEYEKYVSVCDGEERYVLSSEFAKQGDKMPDYGDREELINILNGKK
ncbi:MAG: hypothetical protein IKR23_02735 [Lachnospiraceae bacterium]|nr:hypothetical protein [Lachnospiraceae bacterium]